MKLTKNEIIGIVAALIPFLISVGSKSIKTVNGVVVSSSYFNLIAVIGGIVAIIMAFTFVGQLSEETRERFLHIGVFAAVLLLGGFQLLHGFGIVAA